MLESSRKPSWWITAKTQAARVAEKEPLGAWYYDDDGSPYPGYTPDGPRQFTLDVEAYYRLGLDPLLGIRCKCNFTITDTTIYACTFDRWRPPEFFCAVCLPREYR
jgi:hypothetical protein